MPTITTKDGTTIFFKDWGAGQPVVFHHGWPLSADDWDSQMMFFLERGYRVIAHDRRGPGRSSQTATGNDMVTYAADVAELAAGLDLREAVHVGHSTGGFCLREVPPVMVKSPTNPGGTPIAVFDDIRKNTAFNRAQFYVDLTLPFYGFNRPGATIIEGIRRNWWRQGMMGGVKAH